MLLGEYLTGVALLLGEYLGGVAKLDLQKECESLFNKTYYSVGG